MTPNNQPVNQAVSISDLLAISQSLKSKQNASTIKPKLAIDPVLISLEKYQEAVNFYTGHPNQDMYKSYLVSLSTCKALKKAIELSNSIAKDTVTARKKRLKGMEREESICSLLMQRMAVLESIHHAKSKLAELKRERVEIKRNKKPH